MKRIILCSLTALVTVQLNAQHSIDFSASAGIGKVALDHSPLDDLSDTRVADFYAPTFGINAHYAYEIGNFSIESGLGFNDIKGKHTEGLNGTTMFPDGSFQILKSDVVNTRSLRYLSLPLMFNYRIDKLTLGVGGYLSYMMRFEHYFFVYTEDEMNLLQSVGNSTSKVDYGFKANISYALSDRVSLLFTSNFGLKDISNGKELGAQYVISQFNPIQRSLHNKQFMVGLKFHLFDVQNS